MKLKFIFCLALVLSGGWFLCDIAAHGADETFGLKVMIDIPEYCRIDFGEFGHGHAGRLKEPRTLGNDQPDAHFYVVLENTSAKPVFLVRENGNILILHFEVTGDDGKTNLVYQYLPAPSATAIDELCLAPGQATVVEIRYEFESANDNGFETNYGKYLFPPLERGQSRKVTMRAVLEQKPPKDTIAPMPWIGRIVSEPCEVILENNAL